MSSFLLLGRHHAGIGWIALQLAIGVVLCLQAWQALVGLHVARTTPDGIDDTGLLLVPWMQMAPASDPGVADVLGRLRNVPGVLSATAANQAPYDATAWSVQVWTATHPATKHVVSVFLGDEDFAEICITSAITVVAGEGPAEAFRLPNVASVSVEPKVAEGTKCARSWRITTDVGSDPDYPDVSARDAAALREIGFRRAA